jgi:hypothetical protein
LRDAYQSFARSPALSIQDRVLSIETLRCTDGFLEFRIENQGCAAWAVRPDDDDLDPVVYLRAFDDGHWRLAGGTVSEFFEHVALYEAAFAGPISDNGTLDDDRVRRLHSMPELAVRSFLFWCDLAGPPVRFFGGPDFLIADHAETGGWATARSARALAEVRALLPGEWSIESEA